jgi:flavin-dependent dehydrogenase
VADDLLESAGVRVLLHTAVTGVLVEQGEYRGVVVESNAGRAVVRAARTIDASGDAAVVARAGHGTVFGDDGVIQNPTCSSGSATSTWPPSAPRGARTRSARRG